MACLALLLIHNGLLMLLHYFGCVSAIIIDFVLGNGSDNQLFKGLDVKYSLQYIEISTWCICDCIFFLKLELFSCLKFCP